MDEKEKMKRNLYRRLLICFFACMVFFYDIIQGD